MRRKVVAPPTREEQQRAERERDADAAEHRGADRDAGRRPELDRAVGRLERDRHRERPRRAGLDGELVAFGGRSARAAASSRKSAPFGKISFGLSRCTRTWMPARPVLFWKLSGRSARRAVSVSVFAVVVMPLVSASRLALIVCRGTPSASAPGVLGREREQERVVAGGDRRVLRPDHRRRRP